LDKIRSTGKPWHKTIDLCTFQIGQCRLHINLKLTREFYANQPKISENCHCGYCKYFETTVINQPNQLLDLLKTMEVELDRQPNTIDDGISCIGESKPNHLGYIGNYFVFGKIGKTTKKNIILNDEKGVSEVILRNAEFGSNTQVTIKQVESAKLSFEFYMDVVKTHEID